MVMVRMDFVECEQVEVAVVVLPFDRRKMDHQRGEVYKHRLEHGSPRYIPRSFRTHLDKDQRTFAGHMLYLEDIRCW